MISDRNIPYAFRGNYFCFCQQADTGKEGEGDGGSRAEAHQIFAGWLTK